MSTTNALVSTTDRPELDRIAEPLGQAVRQVFEAGGPVAQQAKDALHGVWLGHPLHPVFTDVPIGAWTTALALDAAGNEDPGMRRAATFAMGVGLAGALGAAVTGLTDWSETQGQSRRTGLVHGLLNLTATSLVATAFFQAPQQRPYKWKGLCVDGVRHRACFGVPRRCPRVRATCRGDTCRCRGARRLHLRC